MNGNTLNRFNLLSSAARHSYINMAQATSHIFTLNNQKFNKVKSKIDEGTLPLMTKYKFGSDHRAFLELAMVGVLGRKLTGRERGRVAYLCDGSPSKIKIDKRDSRTFERTNVSRAAITTHKMGITNHQSLHTLSIKMKREVLKQSA